MLWYAQQSTQSPSSWPRLKRVEDGLSLPCSLPNDQQVLSKSPFTRWGTGEQLVLTGEQFDCHCCTRFVRMRPPKLPFKMAAYTTGARYFDRLSFMSMC